MSRPVEPRPLAQHQAKTVILRVPTPVWGMISTGMVTEFRCADGNAPQLWKVPLPTLAVAYRRRLSKVEYDYRVLCLSAVRREALGAITNDGLAAAGYEGDQAFARWRRDWTLHEKKRFDPLRTVFVYTVRPTQPGDLEAAGLALVEHLYGKHLQEAESAPRTVSIERRAEAASSRDLTARLRHRVA